MARIQIKDLPALQDLTEEQLKELFGAGPRSFKPTFEHLEDRRLMTTLINLAPTLNPAQLALISTPTAQTSTVQVLPVGSQQTGAAAAFGSLNQSTQVVPGDWQQPSAETLAIQPIDYTVDYGQSAIPPLTLTPASGGTTSDAGGVQVLTKNGAMNSAPPYTTEQAQKDALHDIIAKQNQLGSYLGKPVGALEFFDQGYGWTQHYENGKVIVWSAKTGAQLVEGLIGEEYARQTGHDRLGNLYPTSAAYRLPGQHDAFAQYFWSYKTGTGTLIVWTQNDGAHAITNAAILKKYVAFGQGAYGTPFGSEYRVDAYSTAQDFRLSDGSFSTIVSSTRTGDHDVAGANPPAWIDWAGKFGTPVTDSTVWHASGNTQNDIVHFKAPDGSGAAIANLAYGPVFVVGSIYSAWMGIGGADGFGYPSAIERTAVMDLGSGSRMTHYSTFLDGTRNKAIYWVENPDVNSFYSYTHWYVDRGDGLGIVPLGEFTPQSGPTGHEHVDPATGTTSARLTVAPQVVDLSPASQQVLSNADVWATLQSPSYTAFGDQAVWSSSILLEQSAFTNYGSAVIDWAAPADAIDLSVYASILGSDIGAAPAAPRPEVPPADAGLSRTVDLTGANFSLTSEDPGETHQLLLQDQIGGTTIRAQAAAPAVRQETPGAAEETVTVTAVWDPAGEVGVPATLSLDDAGNLCIRFSWSSPDDGALHTFNGIITGDAGSYHLVATDIVRGAGTIDNLVGDQTQATDSADTRDAVPPVDALAGVQQRITDLSDQATQLQAQIADGEAAINSLRDAQSQREQANTDLGVQHDTYQARLDELNQSLSNTGVDLQAAQDAQAQTAAEVARLEAQVQTATQALTTAEQSLAAKAVTLAQAQKSLTQAMQQHNSTAIAKATTAKNQAQQKYDTAVQVRDTAVQTLADAQAALTAAQAADVDAQQLVADIQGRIDGLTTEQSDVSQLLADTDSALADGQATLAATVEQVQLAEANQSALQGEYDALNQALDQARADEQALAG